MHAYLVYIFLLCFCKRGVRVPRGSRPLRYCIHTEIYPTAHLNQTIIAMLQESVVVGFGCLSLNNDTVMLGVLNYTYCTSKEKMYNE